MIFLQLGVVMSYSYSRFRLSQLKLLLFLSLFIFMAWLMLGIVSVNAANCPKQVKEGNSAWQKTAMQACGQKVNFHAWGGADAINDYLGWVAGQVQEIYGVELNHIKISNTADSVQIVLAEKGANKNKDGAVDLIWINGENFRKMKMEGLLKGPFAEDLPNFKYVDVENKPTTINDFTVPTQGYESPWGMAQLVFIYDSSKVKKLPHTMTDFLALAKGDAGRLTYPAPPNFLGVTFLKQALIELISDQEKLKIAPGADADSVSAPLWQYLDLLHPNLWQKGKNFPKDSRAQSQLLADGEIYFSLAFNPNDASSSIARETLPDTVRTFILTKGTIGNTHFVAIPYNAKAQAGAQMVANFLLSPEAQSRKANPEIWGDPTVLSLKKLPSAKRKLFEILPLGVATLTAEELSRVLPEPHPEWSNYLREQWLIRYGS